MEKEYEILTYLMQEKDTTQRKIALNTGISVGGVNVLLKKMIKKGLVKVENINAKSLRYILTPMGIKEKLELTYKFTRSSYQKIIKISQAFKGLVDSRNQDGSLGEIVLYGPQDEIQQILRSCLPEINIPCSKINPEDELLLNPDINSLVVVWRVEDEERLPLSVKAENVLKNAEL